MEIPDRWNEFLLQDITAKTISYGIVQAGSHVDDGIPYIKSSDLTPQIILGELQRTSHVIHEKYVRSSVVPGDIVFSLRGDIGAVAIVPTTIQVANLTQGTARIAANENVDTNFLYQLFKSNILKKAVLRVCKGSTFQEISLKDLRKIKVTLPDTLEQKRIAEILGTWDRAIAATEALITASEAQKKALMQQLLTGKRRLPGFEGEWKEVKLGDVASSSSGGTPKSTVEEYYDGGIQWASVADMTACNKFINKTARTLSQLGLENSSARLFPENTVLIAMYASIGETAIVQNAMSTSQAILGLQAKPSLHHMYLYYLLTAQKPKLKTLGQQGAQSNLNAGMVKALRINLPPFEEQKMIAEVLSISEKEVEALQAKLQTLKTEKAALMQQLLTGKRRVKLTEEAA